MCSQSEYAVDYAKSPANFGIIIVVLDLLENLGRYLASPSVFGIKTSEVDALLSHGCHGYLYGRQHCTLF